MRTSSPVPPSAIVGLTALALLAFAGNSLLARSALVEGAAGAGSFTVIRIVSGAIVLTLLVGWRRMRDAASPVAALALLGYAVFFSYAYLSLPAGTGALILFALVQITMLGTGYVFGESLSGLQWLGASAAFGGLVWLLLPGLDAPSPTGAALMAIAGVCWGAYSLLGRGGGDALARTAGNFGLAAVLAVPLFGLALWLRPEPLPRTEGVLLAVASGALTSGLGYAVWYRALRHLSASIAGISQLAVPLIAALGGIVFLSEPITRRFILASLLILSGIALATHRSRG